MMLRDRQYVYGPTASARFGKSLEINVVPCKTCTYDCIYCHLGRTTSKTLNRGDYAPLADVMREVEQSLDNGQLPDFIVLSGSGEPTLYSKLGSLLRKIKRLTDIPLAVSTNGSLLLDPGVQADLLEADVVISSLDAGDAKLFQYVNRPCHAITFDRMLDGLLAFRRCFDKSIWLEVFLLGGVTAIEAEVRKIAGYAREVSPDKIQLNSVDRPPAEKYVLRASEEQMDRFARLFEPEAEVVMGAGGSEMHETFRATQS